MRDNPQVKRAAGVALIGFVLAVFLITGAFYTRAFTNPAEVTLLVARTGLIMDDGNRVKLNGVEVGRVGEVRSRTGGAELVLDIDRDFLDQIPSNVTVRIAAETVFGAKYVDLVMPDQPSPTSLQAGDVLDASGVTTEVNTIFDSLDRVLRAVDVADLNTTLTVMAEALDGRGDDIATIAVQATDYLTELEPLLPQIRQDLVELARFAELGEQVSPAVLRILENASVTGRTFATEQQAIHRLLVDLSVLGNRGAKLLGVNRAALLGLLDALRPNAATLRAYASELPCLLKGLDKTQQIMTPVLGGDSAGLQARVTIRGALPTYKPGLGLPTMPSGRGATCAGLPTLPPAMTPFPERGGPQ